MAKLLEEYDHERFGPILGVSDDGSAAETIVQAAYSSAKAKASEAADAMCVGVIVDGERMGSAGELPIGPPEYAKVLSAAAGRAFCTTNVGVRVNTRLYQPLPEFRVADAKNHEQAWLDRVIEKFKPFIATPDGKPRPLTIRLVTETRECHEALRGLVPELEAARHNGRIGASDLHRLSFLILFDDQITREQIGEIKEVMALADELGVPEVAIDGELLEAARRRISIQGLLNILEPAIARSLLAHARDLGIRLGYRFEVDPETAARTVWTGLDSAHQQGLTAAKYGLFPLMLDAQRYVVHHIQRWMNDWTPIPAYYVDTPLITENDIYDDKRIVESAQLWMEMVKEEGVKVLLIDAPDRINPHRLLKRSSAPDDQGVLTIDQLETLLEYAEGLGLKVLWSGGNSAAQAFELGKLGVFGIFTTGSTARVVSVHGSLESDKQLAQEKEPTELGVRRVHALLQGGYLCKVLRDSDAPITREIQRRKDPLLTTEQDSEACRRALKSFDEALIRGWTAYWGYKTHSGSRAERTSKSAR